MANFCLTVVQQVFGSFGESQWVEANVSSQLMNDECEWATLFEAGTILVVPYSTIDQYSRTLQKWNGRAHDDLILAQRWR